MPKHCHLPCRQHHCHTSERVPAFAPPPTCRRASGQAPSSVLPPTFRRASKQALRPAANSLSCQQALCHHSHGRQQAVLLPLLETLLIVASMVARWGCSSSLPPRCRLVVAPASEHRRPPRRRLVAVPASKHRRPPRHRLVIAPAGDYHRPPSRQLVVEPAPLSPSCEQVRADVRAHLRQRRCRRHASK